MVTRSLLPLLLSLSCGCSSILGIEDVTYQAADGTVDDGTADGGAVDDGSDASLDALDSGTPGDGSVPDGDAGKECPSTHGPPMVRITKGSVSYCIDTTEITQEQFGEFEEAAVKSSAARCASATFAKIDHATDHLGSNFPQAYVNWCEADAFCAWAGKRLCGKLGGGAEDTLGSTAGEWGFACAGPKGYTYPYGNTPDDARCALGTGTYDDAGLVSCTGGTDTSIVASHATCTGDEAPFSSIHDLSGNVAEWTNACGIDGGIEKCAVRGGNLYDCGPGAACVGEGAYPPFTADATDRQSGAGIRCCAD